MSDAGFDDMPEVPLRQFNESTEPGLVNFVGRVLRHASRTGVGAARKTAGSRPVLSGRGIELLRPIRSRQMMRAQTAQAYITDLNLISYG